MRLISLSVKNLGVFHGQKDFRFAPERKPDGTLRHLSVVSGQNGVGKSTLFGAMSLALHGSLSLGDRVSHDTYNKFLFDRLHRWHLPGGASVSSDANVTLMFQYVQSGRPLHIIVERSWFRNKTVVQEILTVTCDGKELDINRSDYQFWLNDLVPPGLMALCFFDAEQVDSLIAGEESVLGDKVRRLLGLDLVERLKGDLDRFTLSQGGGQTAVDRARADVLRSQADVDRTFAQIAAVESQMATLTAEQARLTDDLERKERELAAEGGTYAARRESVKARLSDVSHEIDGLGVELREMSGDLLPFALAPGLCASLGRRLTEEHNLRRQQTAAALWDERAGQLDALLQTDDLWQNVGLSSSQRELIAQRLSDVVRRLGVTDPNHTLPIVHHVAEQEQEQLETWIHKALRVIPEQTVTASERLRELREERQRIEDELQRAPDDAVLAPLQAAIVETQEDIKVLAEQYKRLAEQLKPLQLQHVEQSRGLEVAADRLRKVQGAERQVGLAERSKLVLAAYQDALIRQRVDQLEDALVVCFNTLCRKDHLLDEVRISPDDWHVELRGANGQVLNLAQFSAGERQLYALALLWALRQVSGRQLPLVIDTPFARLDEIHRQRLLHDYIPVVSDQVVLFATTAEMDARLLSEAEPYIAHMHRLRYDAELDETVVEHGNDILVEHDGGGSLDVLENAGVLVYDA